MTGLESIYYDHHVSAGQLIVHQRHREQFKEQMTGLESIYYEHHVSAGLLLVYERHRE